MLQDPLTLYKLIVLYMLNRVTFPLTAAQVSDFILGKEYTNFLTLQQVINELTDAGMIATQSIRNRFFRLVFIQAYKKHESPRNSCFLCYSSILCYSSNS